MMRDGIEPNARNVAALVTPTRANQYRFQVRNAVGGTTTTGTGGNGGLPAWLRVARVGNTFTGSYSTNGGASWTQLGSTTIAMPPTITLGLAVTSRVDGTVATATFDNVTISQP